MTKEFVLTCVVEDCEIHVMQSKRGGELIFLKFNLNKP